MVAGKSPALAAPRGPRLLRRCPVCGQSIHFQAVVTTTWWLVWRHPSGCTEGPKRALLAEAENGRGDWTGFALSLGLPVISLDEIAVQIGVMPPTEKGTGRLLDPLEQKTILQAYRNVNGEQNGNDDDL